MIHKKLYVSAYERAEIDYEEDRINIDWNMQNMMLLSPPYRHIIYDTEKMCIFRYNFFHRLFTSNKLLSRDVSQDFSTWQYIERVINVRERNDGANIWTRWFRVKTVENVFLEIGYGRGKRSRTTDSKKAKLDALPAQFFPLLSGFHDDQPKREKWRLKM